MTVSHTTPAPARIAVVGDALIDELRDATGSREFIGGAALNVAVGLAVLGHRPTLITMLGDDEPASRIRLFLGDHGVRLVECHSEHGTARAVSDRTDGEPRYEFNYAARHRAFRFGDAARAALDEADLVAVSCYPFDDDEQTALLLEAIGRPERRLVVDGNPRAGMLKDRARFLSNFERVGARSLLVKVGDEDATLLFDASLGEFVARLRTGAAIPAVDGAAVLATAGRDGAAIHHGDLEIHSGIVALPGPVIDTMGAGDATLSAVIDHVARNGMPDTADAWVTALTGAMTIAAATVRHEGALLRTAVDESRVA
jgi:fructokinase